MSAPTLAERIERLERSHAAVAEALLHAEPQATTSRTNLERLRDDLANNLRQLRTRQTMTFTPNVSPLYRRPSRVEAKPSARVLELPPPMPPLIGFLGLPLPAKSPPPVKGADLEFE